jgi:hypothetical protein
MTLLVNFWVWMIKELWKLPTVSLSPLMVMRMLVVNCLINVCLKQRKFFFINTPCKPIAQYQLDMMRCLRAVNVDNNTVGWYRSAHLGNFVDLSLIETQYSYQNSLSAQSVVLIHDVSKSSAQGNLSLRAFRLQENFMKAYEAKKFTTER